MGVGVRVRVGVGVRVRVRGSCPSCSTRASARCVASCAA